MNSAQSSRSTFFMEVYHTCVPGNGYVRNVCLLLPKRLNYICVVVIYHFINFNNTGTTQAKNGGVFVKNGCSTQLLGNVRKQIK